MFEHLKKLDVSSATAWFDFPEAGPDARLAVKPANEANPHYYNALIRTVGKGRRPAKQVTVEDLDRHRNNDRNLYPRYVIVGWEGLTDENGESIPFSRDAATELCVALPDWLFDRLRNFASQPENFLPEDEELPDPQEIAGN